MDVYQHAAGLALPLVYLKVQSWDQYYFCLLFWLYINDMWFHLIRYSHVRIFLQDHIYVTEPWVAVSVSNAGRAMCQFVEYGAGVRNKWLQEDQSPNMQPGFKSEFSE